MNGSSRRARAPNIIGQCGASIITVALCWPYADPVALVAWLIVHQVSVVIMACCFVSRWTTRRLNKHGIHRFASSSLILTLTICGSVMLIDLEASRSLTFTLSALIVMYA